MRAVLWMSGVVVSLAVVIGTSRLWAESKDKKPAAARSRIALINLTYVISNYDKYQQFKEESKEIVEPFERRDAELRENLKDLREEIKKLSNWLDNDEKADRKEELEEKAKKIQREMEDNNLKAKLKGWRATQGGSEDYL